MTAEAAAAARLTVLTRTGDLFAIAKLLAPYDLRGSIVRERWARGIDYDWPRLRIAAVAATKASTGIRPKIILELKHEQPGALPEVWLLLPLGLLGYDADVVRAFAAELERLAPAHGFGAVELVSGIDLAVEVTGGSALSFTPRVTTPAHELAGDVLVAAEVLDDQVDVVANLVDVGGVDPTHGGGSQGRPKETGEPSDNALERVKALGRFFGRHARDLLTPAGPRRADW